MHIALNLDAEVKDGTLVLTDPTGQTITFSKAQTVQKKVSMLTLGELCGLPKRQIATGFGFKTRKSYYDSRNAVLQGSPADLVPKRRGPRSPSMSRSRPWTKPWRSSRPARGLPGNRRRRRRPPPQRSREPSLELDHRGDAVRGGRGR